MYSYDGNNRQIEMIRPMLESATYAYDPVGNRAEVLDAEGQKFTYEYDKFGLLNYARYYNAGDVLNKTVDFDYDDNGNIASYDDGTTSASYTFDDLNRKTDETVDYGLFTKTFSYGYPNNWEATFTLQDNNTVTYTYDAGQRLERIEAADMPGTEEITYDECKWNHPTQITLPGGCSKNYTYDPLMQIKSIISKNPSQNDILTRSYQYSPEGNIDENNTEHGLYTYGYDDVYRLKSATNSTINDEDYTYDDMGNRLTSAGVPVF